jgi:hypothetical protein
MKCIKLLQFIEHETRVTTEFVVLSDCLRVPSTAAHAVPQQPGEIL